MLRGTSTARRQIAIRIFVLGATFAIAVACSDEGPGDDNLPATFGDACTLGASKCAKPFICIADESTTNGQCTLSCSSDEQCPRWEATGHCSGPTQARCGDGVCQRPLCK